MKILIWSKNIKIQNSGGPSGYLYNIKDYLIEHPHEEIDFYPIEAEIPVKKNEGKGVKAKFRNFLQWLSSPYRFAKILYDRYFRKIELSAAEIALIDSYDYVHVHYLSHYSQSFMGFENGHTKIILTTHNPEPLIDQLAATYNSSWMLAIPGFRNYFIKKEISVYYDTDLIMFPVEEAREPYIKRSSIYESAFRELDKKHKFFYVPTALNTTEPCMVNNNVLDKIGISEKCLKVCYVGRHISVKGYDTVQNIAKSAWEKNIPVEFIIGGKEEPLKGLLDCRWHELGWVNTLSLLNEVDVFILPNKDTYFDLILLEVLRQGTPTILTETGGNKWFKQKTEGLFFYKYGDTETAVSIIKRLYEEKTNNSLSVYAEANRSFYRQFFSMKNYLHTYIYELNKLKHS